MKLFVLDPHTIYRRGLAACLALMDEVESVTHTGSVREAWEDGDRSRFHGWNKWSPERFAAEIDRLST